MDRKPAEMSAVDSSGQPPIRKRACPICGKPGSERYAPFCSKRCADVDLHRWLKGAYVIPGARTPEGESGNED
jgi:endogenous inhibitor of DNA gyrase (YacG/DUF329 family)